MGNFGQLGNKEKKNYKLPIEISFFNNKEVHEIHTGALHTMVLLRNGDLYSFGMNSFGQMGNGSRFHHFEPVELTYFKELGLSINVDYINERILFYTNFNLLKMDGKEEKWYQMKNLIYFYFK